MSTEVAEISSPFQSPTFGKDGSFEVNKPVGSMSISPCGRDVVLASRHGLHIVDLDSPWSPPRHLAHHTPWEVADVQWSPFPSRDHWVVSTSNQKALVWNLEMSSRYSPVELVIHGHSRALTDIQFSAHHPDMLATCSVDSFVHCWDLRQPERPAFSFCDWFAGTTQTKWNRLNSHIIASSHDRTLHIWDDRKGATPLRSLDAHDTKIYGIDWSRTDQNKIITCSLDKSIKFWDYSTEGNRPERLLRTPFPVWRARHTPFGYGIMAMPQRGDYNVYLYDCREESIWDRDPDRAPRLVEQFQGHQDNVKEFLWRPRGSSEDNGDNREFQLVTWGADHFLRLHQLNDTMLEKTGFQRGKPGHRTTRRGARYKTFKVDDAELPSIPPQLGPLVAASYHDRGTAMSSNFSTGPLGWADSGFLNFQPGTRAKAPERKDLDPITWMKGVKIGKRDERAKQDMGAVSLPTLSIDTWDQFDNLGEEVSHVGQTFSKVEFNTVDINKRFIRMSMSGPWGKEKSQVFLTCRLDYPSDYPAAAAAMSLQETSSVTSEKTTEITNTTKTIAQAFAQRKKHSTEAIIHYLQGERTLDDLIGLLKQGLETPDMVPVADGGDSSSDDEDDPLSNVQLDQLGLGGSDVLTASNANANVPLPKACGAIWTNDGRLLCFFPPKPGKIGSTAASYGLDGPPGSTRRKSRFFDGFGRFHPLAEQKKSRASSLGTIESSPPSSDSEDDSSLSSSSEFSVTDGPLSDRPHTATQHMMYTSLLVQSISLKPGDGGIGSQTSKPLEAGFLSPLKNVISIHDFRHLLPSKKELADYQYHGPDIGERNAEFASALGYSELANAWQMVANLLVGHSFGRSTGPKFAGNKTLISQNGFTDTFMRSKNGKDTTQFVTLLTSTFLDGIGTTTTKDLFLYFATKADIQSAASVSCALQPVMLSEAGKSQALLQKVREEQGAERSNGRPLAPRQDSFAITEDGESSPRKQQSVPMAANGRDEFLINPPSLASSLGATATDPRSSFSTGHTPPSRRISKTSGIKRQNSLQRLKPSPSRLWNLDGASGLIARAGNFASEISRLSLSASASPPSRKVPSPSISFNTSNLTRGSRTSLPGPGLRKADRSFSTTEAFEEVQVIEGEGDQNGSHKRKFKVTYRDKQDLAAHQMALSSSERDYLRWLLYTYRSAYSELLSIWRLPILRAEVLKHNGPVDAGPAQQKGDTFLREGGSNTRDPLDLSKRFRSSSDDAPELKAVVRTRRVCRKCGYANFVSGKETMAAPFRCTACQSRMRPLTCILCSRMLRGKAFPCPTCGHVMHSRCQKKIAKDLVLAGCCPGGCNCHCLRNVVVEVKPTKKEPPTQSLRPYGSVDTLATQVRIEAPSPPLPASAQYQDRQDRQDQHHRHRSFQDGDGPDTRTVGFAWARESLARNLELRRPRARSVDRRLERGHERENNSAKKKPGMSALSEWG